MRATFLVWVGYASAASRRPPNIQRLAGGKKLR
jgi:hypothetical protein